MPGRRPTTPAGSGGGRSRAEITRLGLEPLADVTGAPLAVAGPVLRETVVHDVVPLDAEGVPNDPGRLVRVVAVDRLRQKVWSCVYSCHLRGERFQHFLPAVLWFEVEHRKTAIIRQQQHLGEQRRVLFWRRGLREQRVQLVELRWHTKGLLARTGLCAISAGLDAAAFLSGRLDSSCALPRRSPSFGQPRRRFWRFASRRSTQRAIEMLVERCTDRFSIVT
jgi:hypothetical protein